MRVVRSKRLLPSRVSGLFDARHDVHEAVYDDRVAFTHVGVSGFCSEPGTIDFVFFISGGVIDLEVKLVVDGQVDDPANVRTYRGFKCHS
mgnify:CR=1 FL=1